MLDSEEAPAFINRRGYVEYSGIFARPLQDSVLEWVAEVQGLKDSLWEGAVLQLSLTYSENYNDVPPTVRFNTIPFHPNVDQYSGRPCIDFLDNPEEWKEKLTISNILLAIQVMLSNPVTENAVNAEAAEMLKNDMPLYRQMVMQCVRNSLHPEELPHTEKDHVSSLKFYQPTEGSSVDFASYFYRNRSNKNEITQSFRRAPRQAVLAGRKQQTRVLCEFARFLAEATPLFCIYVFRGIKRISFEDYHRTWSKIATSKARDHFRDSFIADPEFIGNWKAKNEKGTADSDEDT
ncbi:PREDICTED: ubiquitin-conjugating enzyme E2 U [Tinamus guttatus]|uniref:ubiquitin-conjugating enzyme E2 U n=1 Tax=Tinamus guttatus TaxID=94827 RepID=UPI00052EEE89|nr:PREDICTED: ubiquitin-conjugating enzyme E2 U [Tinamus guttatus]